MKKLIIYITLILFICLVFPSVILYLFSIIRVVFSDIWELIPIVIVVPILATVLEKVRFHNYVYNGAGLLFLIGFIGLISLVFKVIFINNEESLFQDNLMRICLTCSIIGAIIIYPVLNGKVDIPDWRKK